MSMDGWMGNVTLGKRQDATSRNTSESMWEEVSQWARDMVVANGTGMASALLSGREQDAQLRGE